MGSCASTDKSADDSSPTINGSQRIKSSSKHKRVHSSETNTAEKSASGSANSNNYNSSASDHPSKYHGGNSQLLMPRRNNANTSSSENPVDLAASASGPTKKEIKVLLLGSGESGKSTIVKQMKIIHQGGYTEEELREHIPFVYKNILDCIKSVISAIVELQPSLIKKGSIGGFRPESALGLETIQPASSDLDSTEVLRTGVIESEDVEAISNYDYVLDSSEPFDRSIADRIKRIYHLPEVRHFIQYQQRYFYLIDSTHYLLSDIDRLVAPGYIPSVDDVLRTRKKTSGIFHFKFQTEQGLIIHMYDVGGQRSERKKWIHCFDNVTVIIFCVALSEYDQVLLEENSQNRLEESLALFESVVNSRWFARTSIVLFLNKFDVLQSKLPYSPMEAHFPEYTGGQNVNNAAKYILWRFTQTNRSNLVVSPHVTEATDTSNIQVVFAAVECTILENMLKDTGLL